MGGIEVHPKEEKEYKLDDFNPNKVIRTLLVAIIVAGLATAVALSNYQTEAAEQVRKTLEDEISQSRQCIVELRNDILSLQQELQAKTMILVGTRKEILRLKQNHQGEIIMLISIWFIFTCLLICGCCPKKKKKKKKYAGDYGTCYYSSSEEE